MREGAINPGRLWITSINKMMNTAEVYAVKCPELLGGCGIGQ
jgi:hypothetical protein